MRWLLLLTLLVSSCGGATVPADRAQRSGVFLIRGAQPSATIWVDGRFVATVAEARGGVAVAPGEHQLEVRRDGYHSFYKSVQAQAGERREIVVELAEELP